MSKLLSIRQKQNLTQEELYERSGISVRTIQRIEAGTAPQGFTLKALSKALSVSEDELIDKKADIDLQDIKWLKVINLATFPFIFFPPLNIIVPLLMMFLKKEFTPATKRLVTIQIIWSLLAAVLVMMVMMLHDWFGVTSRYMVLIPVAWVIVNVVIILRNAVEIDRNKTLRIQTGFSII